MSVASKIAADAMACLVKDPGVLADAGKFEALLHGLLTQYGMQVVEEYGASVVEKGVSCCVGAIKAKRARAAATKAKKQETALAKTPKAVEPKAK